MEGIFISYRRDDSAGYAGRLYDRLAAHFGAEKVFMDVEGIEPGTDFVKAIEGAVASCKVLIVLIGDQWLTATDASGRRRLDDPHDFIRLETSTALNRDIRVVPVLVDRAAMPQMEDLPQDLQSLVRRQAVELNHKQWEASSGELIKTLEKIFTATGEQSSGDAGPEQTGVRSSRNKPGRTLWIAAAALFAIIGGAAFWQLTPLDGERSLQPSVTGKDEAAESKVRMALRPPTSPETVVTAKPRPELERLTTTAVETVTSKEFESHQSVPDPPSATRSENVDPPLTPEEPKSARLTSLLTQLSFERQESGSTRTREIRIQNTGDKDAMPEASLLENKQGSFSVIVDTCGKRIRAGAGCSYTIAFRPFDPGSHSALLEVWYNGGRRISIPLEGEVSYPAPTIVSLASLAKKGGASVCYQVTNADSLSMTPVPGALSGSSRECVEIPLKQATELTLTARGKGGSINRTVTAAPLPEPEAAPKVVKKSPPSRPTVASRSPTMVKRSSVAPPSDTQAAVKGNAKLPGKGERWVYRTRGKWPTSPRLKLQISIDRADNGMVAETMTILEPRRKAAGRRNSIGADPGFTDWPDIGREFNPWLGAYLDLTGSENWKGFATPDVDSWDRWNSNASTIKKERVEVPAGSFDAWKVEVWSSRSATGGPTLAGQEPVRMQFLVWYAPEIKRYVKSVRRILSANGQLQEEDLIELVEHSLN